MKALTEATEDDPHIWQWLRDGAPTGNNLPVPPGGLLPLIEEVPSVSIPDLLAAPRIEANDPSFDLKDAAGCSGMQELEDKLNEGFAELRSSLPGAEQHLGARVAPSPLGDVVKPKEDDTTKHGVTQDLRASRVKDSSAVGERQVHPRF